MVTAAEPFNVSDAFTLWIKSPEFRGLVRWVADREDTREENEVRKLFGVEEDGDPVGSISRFVKCETSC
jgi:hypothetical protein